MSESIVPKDQSDRAYANYQMLLKKTDVMSTSMTSRQLGRVYRMLNRIPIEDTNSKLLVDIKERQLFDLSVQLYEAKFILQLKSMEEYEKSMMAQKVASETTSEVAVESKVEETKQEGTESNG